MKKLIYVLFLAIIFSCGQSKLLNQEHNKTLYQVYKIDSVGIYYLIYAKKQDSLYKIVSKKEHISKSLKIEENKFYNFKLHSLLKNRFKNTKFKPPMNDLDITCFTFEGNTEICREIQNRIFDLYYADNIKGIYYIK